MICAKRKRGRIWRDFWEVFPRYIKMDRFTLLLSHGRLLEYTEDCCQGGSQSSDDKSNAWNVLDEHGKGEHSTKSSFLRLLTASHKQYVAFIDLDLLKNSQNTCDRKWIEISSSSINECLDDVCLIAQLIRYCHLSEESIGINRTTTKFCEDPVDTLHQLADDLPMPGSYCLEVVIIKSCKGMISPEDSISFYGFLKRLQMWNQAKINILEIDDNASNNVSNSKRLDLDSWKDVIDFGSINRHGFSLTIRPSILWSGSLSLKQENGCHTRISGVELRMGINNQDFLPERSASDKCYSNLMIGDEIEVLNIIEEHDIPLHVLSHSRLKLTLSPDCGDSSRSFFNVVHEAQFESLSFLGCIFFNVSEMHTKLPTTPSTENWLDYVNDKKTEYLVSNDIKRKLPKRCMIVIRASFEKNNLDVLFLKDSRNFSGEGLYSFLRLETSLSKLQVNNNLKAKWKFPLFSEEDILQQQLSSLEELYRKLEECSQNGNGGCTISDFDPIFDNCRSPKYIEVDEAAIENEDYELQYCAASLISPSKWPERLSWNNQEVSASVLLKGSLKRFQSAENHMKLKGIPVAPEAQDEGTTESFLQIRELFDLMGRPIHKDLENIPLVVDRLFKQLPSEDAVKNLSYKSALHLIAHGIDYCLDSQNALKLDAKIVRIQERFLSADTSCSWAPIDKVNIRAKEKQCCEVKQDLNAVIQNSTKSVRNRVAGSFSKKSRNSSNVNGSKANISSKEKNHHSKERAKGAGALGTKLIKETRSQRHQRRLKLICERTLQKYGGLTTKSTLFERCLTRLVSLCKSFLKDLKTSEGLVEEMKRLAKSNVNQVVDFETRGK